VVAADVVLHLQAMMFPDGDTFSMASSAELRPPLANSHVFCAAQESILGRTRPPGEEMIGAALGDPNLHALAMQPKRGFSVPLGPWLAGLLAQLVVEASESCGP
jgi:hypothetical protein